MTARLLIAGIGNIFLGDDAFGSEVARMLLRQSWPENVRVEDFGIRGMDLTFALLDGYDGVILIDTTCRGDVPGTIYTIETNFASHYYDPEGGSTGSAVDMHAMQPLRVLAVAESMGAHLRQIYLVGCEPSPDTIDPEGPGSMGLSDPVQAALEPAAALVRKLAKRMLAGNAHGDFMQRGES